MFLSTNPCIAYINRINESDVIMGNILETEDDGLFSENSIYIGLGNIKAIRVPG